MRLLQISAPLILAASVAADFHIFNCLHSYGLGSQNGQDAVAVGVPSNQYNCNGIRNNPLVQDTPTTVKWGTPYFTIPNLCGTRQLDFYWYGTGFNFYNNGGDGSLVGTCYQGNGKKTCYDQPFDSLLCTDAWVCISYVCS